MSALDRCVGYELAQQADGADRIVVGRNDVVEQIGSTFVSPVPMTGISSLRASMTAMCSRCGSMTNIARAADASCACRQRPGELVHLLGQLARFLLRQPLELTVSWRASSWSSSPSRFRIVTKLVSMPPASAG